MLSNNEPWRRISPMREPTFRAWMERLSSLAFLVILCGLLGGLIVWLGH